MLGNEVGVDKTLDLSTTSFNALATADFNGDTFLDIAALADNELTFFLGSKSGALKAQPPIAVVSDSASLSTGDVDSDGVSDLLVAGDRLQTISYQKTTKTFLFNSGPELVSKHWEELPMSTCDFNKDGKLDVAIFENKLLRVFLGDGAGAFTIGFEASTETLAPFSSLATGDLNGDGGCDLIASGSRPTVWLSDGHSTAKP